MLHIVRTHVFFLLPSEENRCSQLCFTAASARCWLLRFFFSHSSHTTMFCAQPIWESKWRKKKTHSHLLLFFPLSPRFDTSVADTQSTASSPCCCNVTRVLIGNTHAVFSFSRGRPALRPSGRIQADTLIIPADISGIFFFFFLSKRKETQIWQQPSGSAEWLQMLQLRVKSGHLRSVSWCLSGNVIFR